jgi:hypothetical protein
VFLLEMNGLRNVHHKMKRCSKFFTFLDSSSSRRRWNIQEYAAVIAVASACHRPRLVAGVHL